MNGDYNGDSSGNKKYGDDYLKLAEVMDNAQKPWDLNIVAFAKLVRTATSGALGGDVCCIIAMYCNEDRVDHNDCDKSFDEMGCPDTKITRLHPSVDSVHDLTPSGFDIHLCEGIFGEGQTFGEDVCYGSIRVFSPSEMKGFASRIIRRMIVDSDENVKRIIFGGKKRKLNDSTAVSTEQSKEFEEVELIDDDVLYQVAHSLSASGIFDPEKQAIVWEKIFKVHIRPNDAYTENHNLCVLSFGLNAAAMGRGVIAHHW